MNAYAHVHRGMVVFSDSCHKGAALKSLEHHVRWHRRWLKLSLSEARRAAQISLNHKHAPSKRTAQRLVDEAVETMRRDHPKLARHLVADWRQGHRREKGNVVLLSFWLDVPTLDRERVYDRMLKSSLKPREWSALLAARRKRRKERTK